jgi:hypothetical protein
VSGSGGSIFGGERVELADVLSHVLDKGVVLKGEVMLAVADIDLVSLDLGLLLTAVETAMRHAGGGSKAALFPPSAPTPMVSRGERDRSGEVVTALSPPPGASSASLATVAEGLPPRLDADPEKIENGLAKLVLTLIEVLRKVLEHQAVRRMEGGNLSAAEIERLGVALLRLNDKMQDMKGIFGLTDEDLQIDLGPLGRLR